jgi:acyl carrier protein
VVQADVCDEARLRAVLEGFAASGHPLRGVFHAAGVLDDGVLAHQRWDRMQSAMAAKVRGAWNLHTATLGCPLEAFVLFSSAASLLGSSGQASHAAGNAFLDALAHLRKSQGLPGLSIGWGAWSEIGAAARVGEGERGARERWSANGFGTIEPSAGLRALELLVANEGLAHVGVVPIDWPRFSKHRGSSPTFADFASPTPSLPTPPKADLRARIRDAAPTDRGDLLVELVRVEVARVLGAPGPDAVDPRLGFVEQGLDSLTSMELRNRLQSFVGQTLSSTLTFDFPNVRALAEHLGTKLAPQYAPGAITTPDLEELGDAASPPRTVAAIDAMSNGDLDSLLVSLLEA